MKVVEKFKFKLNEETKERTHRVGLLVAPSLPLRNLSKKGKSFFLLMMLVVSHDFKLEVLSVVMVVVVELRSKT
jgi:hypothetical protein